MPTIIVQARQSTLWQPGSHRAQMCLRRERDGGTSAAGGAQLEVTARRLAG